MPWVYHQTTGLLEHDGHAVLPRGYAGKGQWKYRADAQGISGRGPLPRGRYTVGAPFYHSHTGAYSLRLQPDAHNQMFGRSGFLIHGPNAQHPLDSSDGCIVVTRSIRHQIWHSGDHVLEVVQ